MKTKVLKSYLFEKYYQRITYNKSNTVWFKDIPSGNINCDRPLKLSKGKNGDTTLFARIDTMLIHVGDEWKCVSKVCKGDILTEPKNKSL